MKHPATPTVSIAHRWAGRLVALMIGVVMVSVASPRARAAPPPEPGGQPNIVFMMADDLGWTDLACQGSRFYETPNIDRLAASGIRFTNAYAPAPNCAPTRASLLTGLAIPRHGIYTVQTGARGEEKDRGMIPVENVQVLDTSFFTVAESLQDAGYTTASIGKWHLGQSPRSGPQQQGFDVNVAGGRMGAPGQGGYFAPFKVSPIPEEGSDADHLTDLLADHAVGFIESCAKSDAPFFLYMPFYAPHSPIEAPDELINRFDGKPAVGGHHNATYAAMIYAIDLAVGRVLETLETHGLAENTVVVFTSDHGGVGGYRDVGLERRRNAPETTSNAPLVGGKGTLFEGGLRVPLLIRWPGVTDEEAGQTCDSPTTHLDFFPTFAEAAGGEPPEFADGQSLMPLLENPDAEQPERVLVWHFPGYLELGPGTFRTRPSAAIRIGDWKMVEQFETGEIELFNLAEDVSEMWDRADEEPGVVAQMRAAMDEWREETGATMPTPKP